MDSDTWVLVAGIVGALAPLWLSALTRGATSQEEPGVMTVLLRVEELDLREVQRRRATHWLLNAGGIAAGVLIIAWWVSLKYQGAHLWVALGAWLLVALLAGYALPLGLGERFAIRLSGWMERGMGALTWLLSPFLWLVLILRKALGSDDDELLRQYRQMSDDALRQLAHVFGNEDGPIEEDEREMIAGVFQLGDALAREVMVPRPDVVAVDADTPMLDALTAFIQSGHSRIPVYRGSIDTIVGILYAKDLLGYLRDGNNDIPLDSIKRAAYFVPESKEADKLLQEIQQRRTHMAIVVDEYGGVAGLVTIEDLLEEIVGEIRDEYDPAEEPLIRMLNSYEAICNARVDLDDLNRQLSLSLPTREGDTLGGLIYSRLGRIPEVGDNISVDDVEVEVMSVEGQRIDKVKVVLPRPDAGSPDSPSSPLGTSARQKPALLENVTNPLASILQILA